MIGFEDENSEAGFKTELVKKIFVSDEAYSLED